MLTWNFYTMWNNFLKVLMGLLLPLLSINPIANSDNDYPPISISGYVEMPPLNTSIPIHMQVDEGHPFAYVDIVIKVNGTIAINKREITKYISTLNLTIPGFTSSLQSKTINISVSYPETSVTPSVCEFVLNAPREGTIYFSYAKNSFQDTNPIRINYSMTGSTSKIDKVFETVGVYGNCNVTMKNKRVFDVNAFYASFKNVTTSIPETCEIRIYTKIEASDFDYSKGYYSFTYSFRSMGSYRYAIVDEKMFYINLKNGHIQQNYTNDCDPEQLSLFFPFDFGYNKQFTMEIWLYKVGSNQNNYVKALNIDLNNTTTMDQNNYGNVLNFHYQKLTDYLDVDYA